MASSKKSQPQVKAPTGRDSKRKVSRESVIQSAMNGRKRQNHNESHCPYQKGSEAADLWLAVFKTGLDPQDKQEKKTGTVVVEENTAE